MIRKFICITSLFILVIVICGCRALLATNAAPTNPIVQMGIASTNDLASVAIVRALQVANATFNPTPTSVPIDMALGSLTTLLAAAGGWFARHKTNPPRKANNE